MDMYERGYGLRFQKVIAKGYGLIPGGSRGKYMSLSSREEGHY